MNIIKKCARHLVLDWRLTLWSAKMRLYYLEKYASSNADTLRRAFIILFSLFLAKFISHSTISIVRADIFVATGAMIGGIISIVFSLSIFAQQNAADFFSSHFFEVYANDWKEKTVYVAIVLLSLICFGMAIGHEELYGAGYIYVLLLIIAFVFVLLDYQYKNVQRKVSPLTALSFIEQQALLFLTNTHKFAKSLAEILRLNNPSINEGLSLAQAYTQLNSRIAFLDRSLENLIGISMRLAARNETLATKRGLDAIYKILSRYFELRKTSSVIMQSKDVPLAYECDSSDFLRHTFEFLNSAGEQFINQKQDENAAYVVFVYNSLAEACKDIHYINNLHYGGHPILETIHGYLRQYLAHAFKENSIEVIFQSCKVLGDIGVIAETKELQPLLLGIQEDLLKNAQFGLINKKAIITDSCNQQWLRLISGIFAVQMPDSKIPIHDALHNISSIELLRHSLTLSGLTIPTSGSQPYIELRTILRQLYARNQFQTKEGLNTFIEFQEELTRSLRKLSELHKNCDSLLTHSIAGLLDDIDTMTIALLSDATIEQAKKSDLLTRLHWSLHLPSWFVHHAQTITNTVFFMHLSDVPIKVGIKVFNVFKDEKILFEAVSSFFSIVKDSFSKLKNNGFDEPRLMLKLCFLGVLALKHKKIKLLEDIQLKIYEFESRYETKYSSLWKSLDGKEYAMGAPRKDQLFLEVWNWRSELEHDRYNSMRISGDSDELILDLVSKSDIDRFMFEIWWSYPADSSIKQELEEQMLKRSLLTELVNTLSYAIKNT